MNPRLLALGARIRSVRKARGITQGDFALEFGVTQAAISNWEKGYDSPSPKALAQLARTAAFPDLKEFFEREYGKALAETRETPSPSEETRPIRLLKDSVAAGTPRAADERNIEKLLHLPRSWFPSTEDVYALRVSGNSMAPVIQDGFIVLVDASKHDPKTLVEKMVAAREGDGITIKWLRRDGDLYLLVPQNVSPRYPVRVIREHGDFSIAGVVLSWIGRPSPVRK